MLFLALTFLWAGLPAEAPHESAELERILADAQAAPPEWAADLRLQLLEKGLIKTSGVRLRALLDAFDLANGAAFKLPLNSVKVGGAAFNDSDAGMLSYAAGLRVDTLSVQLRAVTQLLRYDPKAALEMFRTSPGPQIPALTCSDAMGYSLELYYTTLSALYNGAFTADDRKTRLDFQFLIDEITQLGTAFELEPTALMLNSWDLNKDQLSQAVIRFAQAMADVSRRRFEGITQVVGLYRR